MSKRVNTINWRNRVLQFRLFSSRFFRYCLVGGLNTVVTVSVMASLAWMGVHYTIYTACGYFAAFLVSFVLNMRFTFRVAGQLFKRLSAFIAINLCNLIIVESIQIFLIEFMGISHLFAIMTGMVWYALFGFFMNQRYVFRNAKPVMVGE